MRHLSPAPTLLARCKRVTRQLEAGILPPRCAGCNWFDESLFCATCRARVQRIVAPFCARCGQPFDPLVQVLATSLCADCRANRYHAAPILQRARSLWAMSGPVRHAVHRFKYQNRQHLAANLAREMATYLLAENAELPQLIVPVPLHPWRQWRRGYNQSALLAHALAELLQLPCVELLRRTRHTPSQTRLNQTQRQENVRDAFVIAEKMRGKYLPDEIQHILLIDDVYTTGATLRECARRLHSDGFATIHALTLTRQPPARPPKLSATV